MGAIHKVIVVGAGPTGLLLALLLAQRGISVQVVEAHHEVDQRPRGLAYGPSATRVLRRAGVLDDIRSQTWDVETMSWRKLDGDILASMSLDNSGPDAFVLFPVHRLSNLVLQYVLDQPTASVHMSHRVVGVGQDGQSAWVDVKAGEDTMRMHADFVVGCDGAGSAVRKALYGDDFPGTTWDRQLVVTNTYYDVKKYGWSDLQWIIDPSNWGMVCGVTKEDNLWRVVYGEDQGYSHDELRARLPAKFEKLLPGHPKPEEYEVVRFSPFVMHQRCVDHMRVGRVLLAGDAAHLCNPMGGLGLTCGISDIGSLVDCFYGIHDGRATVDILDKYDEVRRSIFKTVIDPLSTANLQRLWCEPEDIRHTDPFFIMTRTAVTDPAVANEMKLLNIAYDMTQHYTATASSEQAASNDKGGVGVSTVETPPIGVAVE